MNDHVQFSEPAPPSVGHTKRHRLTIFKDAVPSVHGKPSISINGKTRLSTHQRNLSLDFRSMGILLPPITQVTVTPTTTNLTLHHRNRSLDSALQRIPEVDVTPSPECEKVTATILSNSDVHSCTVAKTRQRDEVVSLGSDDSGILCGSDSGASDAATREPSIQLSRESLQDAKRCEADDDAAPPSPDDAKAHDAVDVAARRTCAATVEADLRPEVSKSFGLLRLLESRVFDVAMAIHYLFKSKEPGVQSYIANKLFSFPDGQVDFYLPQLVFMYIQMHDVAEVIHPYLVHRCRQSIDFSLKCAWLLDAYGSDASAHTKKKPHSVKLKNLILSEELRPKNKSLLPDKAPIATMPPFGTAMFTPPSKKSHQRSFSDASALIPRVGRGSAAPKLCLGDLSSGRAFDNGCPCFDGCIGLVNDLKGRKTECTCTAPRLAPQLEFLKALILIGKLLSSIPTKEAKTTRLVAELTTSI
ncbi:hypothetical protein WA026_019756 [Henosepilachna vigintioctopunctata]|uniref:PIK helical domain-containing protein n=1 Tax=Henosepilachna vigintioctopunctata TaxID=420089 RepID=A0AAW1UQI4_9CUCU